MLSGSGAAVHTILHLLRLNGIKYMFGRCSAGHCVHKPSAFVPVTRICACYSHLCLLPVLQAAALYCKPMSALEANIALLGYRRLERRRARALRPSERGWISPWSRCAARLHTRQPAGCQRRVVIARCAPPQLLPSRARGSRPHRRPPPRCVRPQQPPQAREPHADAAQKVSSWQGQSVQAWAVSLPGVLPWSRRHVTWCRGTGWTGRQRAPRLAHSLPASSSRPSLGRSSARCAQPHNLCNLCVLI